MDIKRIIRMFMHIFPVKNTILLESKPSFSDNTFALYQEMLDRGINKKYKIIWLAEQSDIILYDIPFNVYVYRTKKSLINRIILLYIQHQLHRHLFYHLMRYFRFELLLKHYLELILVELADKLLEK